MGYKERQTQRGIEAVKMVVDLIEAHHGVLEGTSVHEANYSSGQWGKPDLVFRQYAIEVKRVELLVKQRFDKGERYYAHLNNVSILHESWDALKEWCGTNAKHLILIAVLTTGRQDPLFVGFSQAQIDALQRAQRHKKWVQLNVWQILHQGTILKTPNFEMVNHVKGGD